MGHVTRNTHSRPIPGTSQPTASGHRIRRSVSSFLPFSKSSHQPASVMKPSTVQEADGGERSVMMFFNPMGLRLPLCSLAGFRLIGIFILNVRCSQ